MGRGWIAVDLDNTLATYDKFHGLGHIGPPVPLMVERIKAILNAGDYDVKLFSARVSDPEWESVGLPAWQQWSQKYLGTVLEATNSKDFDTLEIWDDKAVQVEKNTGEFTVEVLARKLLQRRKYVPAE